MYTTDELFDDEGWCAFHDVVIETSGCSLSPKELRIVFEALPRHIRDIAHSWSLSDTVFRDSAYTYLKEKGLPAYSNVS